MTPVMANITNNLISIGFMLMFWLFLKNKNSQTPGMKLLGMSFKTFTIIIFILISIQTLLIIATAAGWIAPIY